MKEQKIDQRSLEQLFHNIPERSCSIQVVQSSSPKQLNPINKIKLRFFFFSLSLSYFLIQSAEWHILNYLKKSLWESEMAINANIDKINLQYSWKINLAVLNISDPNEGFSFQKKSTGQEIWGGYGSVIPYSKIFIFSTGCSVNYVSFKAEELYSSNALTLTTTRGNIFEKEINYFYFKARVYESYSSRDARLKKALIEVRKKMYSNPDNIGNWSELYDKDKSFRFYYELNRLNSTNGFNIYSFELTSVKKIPKNSLKDALEIISNSKLDYYSKDVIKEASDSIPNKETLLSFLVTPTSISNTLFAITILKTTAVWGWLFHSNQKKDESKPDSNYFGDLLKEESDHRRLHSCGPSDSCGVRSGPSSSQDKTTLISEVYDITVWEYYTYNNAFQSGIIAYKLDSDTDWNNKGTVNLTANIKEIFEKNPMS